MVPEEEGRNGEDNVVIADTKARRNFRRDENKKKWGRK